MERGLLMGDSHKSSDSIVASKSVGSFVKIDSISIDLDDANGKSHPGKCEHFSIRGYVSEIRKKNLKICWPFASDGDLNKFDQEQTSILPPLDTPKFRWWRCQNSQRETGSKIIAKDHGTNSNYCLGSDPNNTCQMPHLSDAMLLSDCQQGPKSKLVEGKKVDADASAIVNGNEQHPSSCINKKEGKDEVAPTTIIANENGSEDNLSNEMPTLNSVETEVKPNGMQEKHNDDAEALQLECNGSVEVCKLGCESHDDTNAEIETKNNKCWNKNSTQISKTEYQSFADDKHKESMNAYETCKIAGMVDKVDNAIKVQTNIGHPLVLDECEYASSENHDKSSGLHHKKSRKVRLLTELLCNNGDAKTDCFRTEGSPSNTINNTSGAGTASHGQVSLQENARAGPGENKKRKLPQEEEQGCLDMSHRKILNKKVKAFKRDEEITNAIAGSELEEDAFARISLQADPKSNWIRSVIERIPTIGKKKTKKSNDFDACSSLVPTEGNVSIEALGKVENSSKGNATKSASFGLTYNASTGRGMDQIPLPAPKPDRKSGSCKKKGKMPQVDNGQASLFPWTGMHRKGPNTRKDVEVMQTGQVSVPFHLAEDASTEKGQHLSLNSYLAAQRYGRKFVPQVEDGFPSLSTWQDGTCKLDEFMRKNLDANYAAKLNKPSTSVSNAFSGKGVHGELSSKFHTHSMPILNEKQKYSSQVEQGSCSLMQKMDISRASNNEKIIEAQKNSAVSVSRKHSNHRSDKMSEQGASDEIPMEIVELMAKNQYERCLHDADNTKHMLEPTNKARKAQVMDHSKVYGTGDLRILGETSQKRKPEARNAKNGIITRKNVGPAKQKSVDYFSYINGNHFGMSRPDQMPCPAGVSSFSQSQKKPSTRGQFPAAGYSRCSCAQNCKWDGDMMGQGFSHSSLQTLAACNNTCHSVPQPKEGAARLWSSVVPVHTPLTYNNPQKFTAQPSNVNMLSHSPLSLHKGNINGDYDLKLLNLNATNLAKHNEDVGPQTFRRTNAEYSFTSNRNGTDPHQNSIGPLDLYSNETIPAMHLLSLMDAGMQSGAPFNMGGNRKFLKRPYTPDLNSKEYSGMEIGVACEATDTLKHPSPNYYGKNHQSGKSLDLFPMNPTGGASSSSFQHSEGFERATEFMGQVSLSSRRKERIQSSNSPEQNRGLRSQKSICSGGALVDNHGTIPANSMQKGFLPVSSPMMFPLHSPTIEYSMKHKLETHNTNGVMKPPKSSSESLICSINRNPADFSFPEAGNVYMIGGEDLKFGKQISPEKRHGLIKVDQHKRQRNTKQTTGKERARH